MKKHFGKSILALLAAGSILAACNKANESYTLPDEMQGHWALADQVQVNDPAGLPRQLNDLETLSHQAVSFHADGSFSTPGNEGGQWVVQQDKALFKFSNGRVTTMRIARITAEAMLLEQPYAPSGDKAGGTIYYQFTKQ